MLWKLAWLHQSQEQWSLGLWEVCPTFGKETNLCWPPLRVRGSVYMGS